MKLFPVCGLPGTRPSAKCRPGEATGLPLQAAALPWRRSSTGGVEYLLVASEHRWLDRPEGLADAAKEHGGIGRAGSL